MYHIIKITTSVEILFLKFLTPHATMTTALLNRSEQDSEHSVILKPQDVGVLFSNDLEVVAGIINGSCSAMNYG